MERLESLDAFRGATIALMILVNTPGDWHAVYGPLNHAEWHGWTITDVVFPSFLWIVGVAITLSLEKRLAAGSPRGKLLLQAARRAAILFLLGLISYALPDFNLSTQRILGVLQRIGICYFIAAAIYLWTGWRAQIAWIVGLLGVYWALMAWMPVPGYGAGRLDVEGNFAHYIDAMVLGRHNWAATKTWDPEGIVSTLPAIATTLLGVLAGHMLKSRKLLEARLVWLFAAGNLLIPAGLIVNQWLPINKKLWTSSFVLFMGGLDFVIFALFLWIVDALGYKRVVRPFLILGMNAIAIYMLSEMVAIGLDSTGLHGWIYRTLFASWASPFNASFLYAIAYTMSMYAIAYLMYRRGWFLRV